MRQVEPIRTQLGMPCVYAVCGCGGRGWVVVVRYAMCVRVRGSRGVMVSAGD